MITKTVLAVSAVLALCMILEYRDSDRSLPLLNQAAPLSNAQKLGCDDKSGGIRTASHKLSSGEFSQIEQARSTLLNYAKRSPTCRNQVIGVLMQGMDQPNLNFEKDIASYNVWKEGSQLLGELKATEALDLLISHLAMTNGFHNASMVFQPAILGVRQYGPVAIPKLEGALRQSPNRDIRMAAAYCLTVIGGPSAADVLKNAESLETNECVAQFMRISLRTFLYKSGTGRLLFDNNAPQADRENRRRWLTAFECLG